jgi:hypothetical protein
VKPQSHSFEVTSRRAIDDDIVARARPAPAARVRRRFPDISRVTNLLDGPPEDLSRLAAGGPEFLELEIHRDGRTISPIRLSCRATPLRNRSENGSRSAGSLP